MVVIAVGNVLFKSRPKLTSPLVLLRPSIQLLIEHFENKTEEKMEGSKIKETVRLEECGM